MTQISAQIVERKSVAPAWWQLTLAAPEQAAKLTPGQFCLVRCAASYLRRPVFPAKIDAQHLSLLLRPAADPGLAWLLARQPGETLDLIGPLGTGFPQPDAVHRLLLISDSQGLSPLLGQMERALAAKIAVTLALEGSRATTLYPIHLLPPAVEVYTATLDGSLGQRGSISEQTPKLLAWADLVCAAGSARLYQTLCAQAAQIRLGGTTGFLYGLVTDYLVGCGLGACFGCAIETTAGLKLTCSDGPVFDLATIAPGS